MYTSPTAIYFIEQWGYKSDPLDFEFSPGEPVRALKERVKLTNSLSMLKTTAVFFITPKPIPNVNRTV